ncbi:unnamed protein product, partial [Prorocentrum cordatum]
MPPCQTCLSHGVQGEALTGRAFCAAHGGVSSLATAARSLALPPGLAPPVELHVAAVDSTGATQAVEALRIDADEDDEMAQLDAIEVDDEDIRTTTAAAVAAVDAVAAGTVTPNPASIPLLLRGQVFQQWLDQEVLHHFELVQACALAAASPAALAVEYPCNWAALHTILKKLGYAEAAPDPWQSLGFARNDGPEPSAQSVAARARTAIQLCELSRKANWSEADRAKAEAALQHFSAASDTCTTELPDVLRESRRVRTGKLPLWKEVGKEALEMLRQCAGGQDVWFLTQWSSILSSPQPGAWDVHSTRAAATLLEKGDENIWEQLADKHVVAWIPEDPNATSRCRASLLRRVAAGQKPASLKLIAPLPLFLGAHKVGTILDNWWSPLLGESWAPLVRRCEFSDYPMELILPGPTTPRHAKMGLAVFTIAFSRERAAPTMLNFRPPLLQTEAAATPVTFDMRAEDVMPFSMLMRLPLMAEAIWRNPRRSPAATSEIPRVCIDVLFPKSFVDLDTNIILQDLRRLLPSTTFFGTQALYSAADAMILEINSALGLQRFWPLCTHLLVASSSKVLLLSGSSGDTWASTMDRVLMSDPSAAATLLRWKPSRGGRKVATPSATTRALTATRKKAHKPPASLDHLTEVVLNGELGREHGEVVRLLLTHLATTTGLGLTEKGAGRTLQHGEFEHIPWRRWR